MSERRTTFVYPERLAERSYSAQHPFKPIRAALTREMCEGRGLFGRSWMSELRPGPAGRSSLELVHDSEYLDVLQRASEGKLDERTLRHGLGSEDCPLFTGLWDACLETAGAVAESVGLLLDDHTDIVFSPAGGMHHALADAATGFCYINDVALACRLAANRGLRVAYVDLDAHHGNGVQSIFWEDPRVLVFSFHESGHTLYPWEGFVDEIGAGAGRGFNVNIPFEPDTDDATLVWTYRQVARPLLGAFAPDLLVVELGADGLAIDPLAHLRYTNNGLADVLSDLIDLAPKVLITGGGGYDVKATTRAWSLCWSVVNRIEPVADAYTTLGGVFIGDEQLVGGSLRDMNVYVSGPDRERVRAAAESAVAAVKREVFPIHGLPAES